MTNYTIPKPNAPLAEGGTPPRREWYNFLRGLYDLYETSDSTVQAEITALCYKLGSPDGTIDNIPSPSTIQRVVGKDSVISNGLDYVTLNLDGDVLSAPALTFYGAITAGAKGWQPYSSNFQKTTTTGVDYLDLVDLSDSGTGTFKLLTRDTKGRLSGTVDGAASDVPVTSFSWKILTGSNVQTAFDSTDAYSLHNASTGVHYGMRLTINGTNPSAVDISAGNGQILDNSVPGSETFTTITYAGQTGIAVTDTAAPITWWSIDASGTVVQSTTAPIPDDYRTSIQLGYTIYNGGMITQLVIDVDSLQQVVPAICDLFDALGIVNQGIYPYINGANLSFNVSAGRLSSCGANVFNNPLDPNFISYGTRNPATFRYGTQSSEGTTDLTVIDPTSYDVGGVITPVPGSANHATIQTVWQSVAGPIRVQYGQDWYNTLSEALANISSRTFVANPTYAAEGTIVGAIIVTKGATDLSNASQAIFVKANKFGEFVGGTGSAASVISFNGRSGIVVPASGDYTTDQVTEATNLYFTEPRVLATPLTGLSTATSTPITAADTVLSAAGKLQAQITGLSGAPGYIDGLQLQWVSATALTVSSGTAYIEGLGYAYQVASPIAKTSLSLSASTWYHVYLYDNAGTPDFELSTTVPASPYNGTARSKTGDTSRRYVGSILTNASSAITNFVQDGNEINYRTNVGGTLRILSSGVSTTLTDVSASFAVPVTSKVALLRMANTATNTYFTTGTSDFSFVAGTGITSVNQNGDVHLKHPVNSSQSIQYIYKTTPTGGGAYIDVDGYSFER